MAASNWPLPARARPRLLRAFGVVGFELQSFLQGGDGLVELAFAGKGVAKVVEGFGEVGFELQSFLQGGDGLVELAFVGEGIAEVVEGLVTCPP